MVTEMDKRNNLVVLSLGGNVGDVKEALFGAIKMLSNKVGKIEQESSLYQTAAWGVENQPDFLNQVITLKTKLLPHEVLRKCLDIEIELGRDRSEKKKWQQRVVDIDVLFYGNNIIKTTDLIVPHPYLQDINFVLFPLAEIIPDFRHPILKETVIELKKKCTDNLQIKRCLD